jgi:microcystin-dependent protein
MKRRNWVGLGRKLIDRFDMLYTIDSFQEALGKEALASWGPGVIPTHPYPTPFTVTMSGAQLGGTVSPGRAYDINGQILEVLTPQTFALTADNSLPRRALLVLRHKLSGNTLIPMPSDPIQTTFLNLVDDFTLEVLLGTPGASPAYPTKGPTDIVLMGFLIPAGALFGTQCPMDSEVREEGFRPATRVTVDRSNLLLVSQRDVQHYIDALEVVLQQAAFSLGGRAAVHDQVEIVVNNSGVQGNTLTIAGTTLTFGNNPNEIPLQSTANAMAFVLARSIREHATLSLSFTASASKNVVTVYALAEGPNGSAVSATGSTVTPSASSFSGNRSRFRISKVGIQAQLDQIDEQIYRHVPPGTIIDFGGDTAPTGFLACDGSQQSRATYAALFAAIGTRWGAGNGTTTFNLPDFRGYFRRGRDAGVGRDPDRGSRTNLYSGGATGDNVGSYQGPATKVPNSNFSTGSDGGHTHTINNGGGHTHTINGVGDHTHFYVAPFGDQGSLEPDGVVAADEPEFGNNTGGGGSHSHSMQSAGDHNHSMGTAGAHSHNVTGGGDAETRPSNAYVLPCIKF